MILLSAVAHLAQAELNQMLRFEFAARPAVSLCELDSKEVIRFFKFAVLYTSLTAITLELKRKHGFGCYGFLEFKTGTR